MLKRAHLFASLTLPILAACQVAVVPHAAPVKPRVAATTPAASPGDASAKPDGAAASPSGATSSPASARPNLLVTQGTGKTTLSGIVSLDPSYLELAHAGQLISQDGGGLVAAGNVKLISQDGGGVISNDGSTLISQDGSSLISQDGGGIVARSSGNVVVPASLISQDGGSVISNDGSTLISQDGGGLISQDGGGIVAQGGGNLAGHASYQLQDTGAGAGNLIPAAGMVLWVQSLETGEKLPLGVDAKGQPVYAIYTNLKGGFTLTLPGNVGTHVDVRAFVPGKGDVRLRYDQFASSASADGVAVNDDTAMVSEFMRNALGASLLPVVKGNLADALAAYHYDEQTEIVQSFLKTGFTALTQAAVQGGYDKALPDQQIWAAHRLAEKVLALGHVEDATPDDAFIPTHTALVFKPDHAHAVSVLAAYLNNRRLAVTRLFAANPKMPELIAGQLDVQALEREHLEKYPVGTPLQYATLLSRGFIGKFFADMPDGILALDAFEKEIGLQPVDGGTQWMASAVGGMSTWLMYELAGSTLAAAASSDPNAPSALDITTAFLKAGPPKGIAGSPSP